MTELADVLTLLIPIVSTLISGVFGSQWAFGKQKVSQIRDAMQTIEEALEDDKISEQEFRKIYYKFSAIAKS